MTAEDVEKLEALLGEIKTCSDRQQTAKNT